MTPVGPCLLALLLALAGPATETAPPDSPPGDRYDPAGRRDPFLPLVAPDAPGPLRGLEEISWQNLVFVGILDDPGGGALALFFGGPEPMGYFLAPGALFRNGTLEAIEPGRGRVVIRGARPREMGPPERHVLSLRSAAPGG